MLKDMVGQGGDKAAETLCGEYGGDADYADHV